jgi:hypothetical protein
MVGLSYDGAGVTDMIAEAVVAANWKLHMKS